MVNTKVTLCGIEMDNPIIPASGTFGFGYEFAELYDINVLGTFSFKGTTREPRFGNPTPRIAEYAGGLLNAVGLQNPGVDAVIAQELPRLREVFHKPVMANVCGFSVDEYVEVAAKLDRCPEVGWLEINISCPNVHGGGMGFGTTCEGAAEVTRCSGLSSVWAGSTQALRLASSIWRHLGQRWRISSGSMSGFLAYRRLARCAGTGRISVPQWAQGSYLMVCCSRRSNFSSSGWAECQSVLMLMAPVGQ